MFRNDLVEVLMKKTGLTETEILKLGGKEAMVVGDCYEVELAFVAVIGNLFAPHFQFTFPTFIVIS